MSRSSDILDLDATKEPAPLISIIMPCHGMGKYIGEALESVGKQTYTHWEVIAVDDCGPDDGTKEIIESFVSEHPEHRVELIRHEENKGVSAARNTAIEAANGEFIAPLDPDDRWKSRHLETLVFKAKDVDDNTAVIFADFEWERQNDNEKIRSISPSCVELAHMPFSLALRNFIQPSACIIRAAALHSVSSFDETPELQHVEDWDLWIRLAQADWRFYHVAKVTITYRHHSGSASCSPLSDSRQRALESRHSHFFVHSLRTIIRSLTTQQQNAEHQLAAVLNSRLYRLAQIPRRIIRRILRLQNKALNIGKTNAK